MVFLFHLKLIERGPLTRPLPPPPLRPSPPRWVCANRCDSFSRRTLTLFLARFRFFNVLFSSPPVAVLVAGLPDNDIDDFVVVVDHDDDFSGGFRRWLPCSEQN